MTAPWRTIALMGISVLASATASVVATTAIDTVAHAAPLTGAYNGTTSDGWPVVLEINDTTIGAAYGYTVDPSPVELYDPRTGEGENSGCCGYAAFTSPTSFSGSHSEGFGDRRGITGTVDEFGHASGTWWREAGVPGYVDADTGEWVQPPPVRTEGTWTATHPNASDPTTTAPTTTAPATTAPATTAPASTAPASTAPATTAPATTASGSTTPATSPPATTVAVPAVGTANGTSSFAQGAQTTFVGTGFQPGESVTGTFRSDPIPLGTQIADGEGTVRFPFTIPATIEPGIHHVELVGAVTGMVRLEVVVSAPSNVLPSTGSQETLISLLGVVLVALGLAVMLAARRRPTTS